MPTKCTAVIVTYEPDAAGLLVNLRAIAPQVDHVYLCDNSVSQQAREMVAKLAAQEGASHIDNQGNLGVAVALNRACQRAMAEGSQWIVTLDQDSVVSEGWLEHAYHTLSAITAQDAGIRPAMFSAVFHDTRSGITHRQAPSGSFTPIAAAITSGSMLLLDAWQAVGGFADEYFIDYVDIEMCLRLRQAGYSLYEVPNNCLHHQLGTPTVYRWFGLRMVATNHTPIRRYHLVRNSLWLYRAYWKFDRRFVINDSKRVCKQLCKVMLLERQRLSKIAAIGRGFWHGLTRTPSR